MTIVSARGSGVSAGVWHDAGVAGVPPGGWGVPPGVQVGDSYSTLLVRQRTSFLGCTPALVSNRNTFL